MKTLTKFTLTIICLALVASFSDAQTSSAVGATADESSTAASDSSATKIAPEKEAEIRKLLELTGTVKMMNQMMDQMMSSFATQSPSVPPEMWTKFRASMDMNSLIERLMPVYDKYYTLEDLKTINAFYETPAGKRMISALPNIMHDSMQIGQKWGVELGAKVQKEIQDEKASSSQKGT